MNMNLMFMFRSTEFLGSINCREQQRNILIRQGRCAAGNLIFVGCICHYAPFLIARIIYRIVDNDLIQETNGHNTPTAMGLESQISTF